MWLCWLASCVSYGSPIAEPAEPVEGATMTAPALLGPLEPPAAPSSPLADPEGTPDSAEAALPSALDPANDPGSTGAAPADSAEIPQPGPATETAAAPPGTPPPDLPLLGTSERPQLDPVAAASLELLDYLALAGNLPLGLSRDDWDPTAGGGDVLGFVADYRVAASGGTHTRVQAAISAAVAAGGNQRRYIELAAGTYREVVCVPSGAPPITLYGVEPDATQTVIVFDNYAGKAKPAGTPGNPCNPNTAATTYGTSGSATLAVFARDFVAQNLSIVNDTDERGASGSVQAPALLSQGDRVSYENVRVLGNQDTLLVKTPNVDTVTRAYFKSCYIEGDSEFILGRGTLVLDGCTIHSLTSRLSGAVLAPSTDARNPFGMLVTGSSFTADAAAQAASVALGRAWDENQTALAGYAALVSSGVYPNGQLLVRQSVLGAHIQNVQPWRSALSTARPFAAVAGDYPANRLYEFANAGPGSASPQP